MKYKRNYLFLIFMIVLVLCSNIIVVNAVNTGFSTEKLTKEEQTTFESNVMITLLTEEPDKRSILCFDVNENGLIAIGQKGDYGEQICVYSSVGEFIYGYSFETSGSFGVEWDNERINIYFARSGIIISVDSQGKILGFAKVQTTNENNRYVSELLYSNERCVGDSIYSIRNDMGLFNLVAMSYSQIVITDANGSENIIYDVNSNQILKTVAFCIIVIAIIIIAVVCIAREFIKLSKSKTRDGSIPLKKAD